MKDSTQRRLSGYLRVGFGTGLLLFQVGAIVAARFSEARYFAWAPYDRITRYSLSVTIRGRELNAIEVEKRYRLPAQGRDNRSQQHIIDIIREFERTIGEPDGARVALDYSTNGGPSRRWNWPPRERPRAP